MPSIRYARWMAYTASLGVIREGGCDVSWQASAVDLRMIRVQRTQHEYSPCQLCMWEHPSVRGVPK